MEPLDVLVSGAGVAGLTAARLLHLDGHRVTVVERAPRIRSGGYAVDFRGDALDVLSQLGLLERLRDRATPLTAVRLLAPDGSEVGRQDASSVAGELEVRKPVLMAALADLVLPVVTIVHDDTIVELADGLDGVTARFERHPDRTFDLVVGADGVHSRVRSLAMPTADPLRPLGLVGAGFSVSDRFGESTAGVLWQAPGLAAYVVDAGEPGRRTVSLSCAAPPRPLDRASRKDQEAFMRGAFVGHGWCVPQLLEEMSDADDFFFAAAVQVVLPRWSAGRSVLLGDAAGCAAPTSGMGTSQALLGAAALVAALEEQPDVRRAMQHYECRMRPVIEANQELGRLGAAAFGAAAA